MENSGCFLRGTHVACGPNMDADRNEQLSLEMDPDLPFAIVMSQPILDRGFAVVLRSGTQYGACVIRPAAELVVAPNHDAGWEGYSLCASMSAPGFAAVVDWTDRLTALRRYARLIAPSEAPPDGVPRLLDRIGGDSRN